MKKPVLISIIVTILIILILVLIPKQKSINGIRLSELNNEFTKTISLDYDHSGKMNKSEVFFSIKETESILQGSYFQNQNKAIAAITYFYGVKTTTNNYVVILKSNNRITYSLWEFNKDNNEFVIIRKDFKRNLFKKYKIKSRIRIHLTKIKRDIISSNGRYRIPRFKPELKHKNINYGKARGYYDSKVIENTKDYYKIAMECLVGEDVWYKRTLDLNMDIYEPKNDTLVKKPLIVFFHGGAFIIGDKTTETVKEFCNFYASRGYIVAAPNYRMGYGLTKSMMKKNIERCAYRAIQDGRASIRYMVKNANAFNIDTSKIFVAGYSAGGVIALNIAYMDDNERPASSYKLGLGILHKDLGNLDESTNNIKSTFTIKGVINMWGALGDSSLIQEDENIPLLSFHGDNDHIVPYNIGQPFEDIKIAILEKLGLKLNDLIFEPMFGSKYLSDYYKSEKYDYTLVTFKGFDHDPHSDPDQSFNSNLDTIKQVSEMFLYDNLIPAYSITGPEIINSNDIISEYSVPYYEGSQYYWIVSGGVVVEDYENINKIKVIWFRRSVTNKLNIGIKTPNDAIRTNQIIISVN